MIEKSGLSITSPDVTITAKEFLKEKPNIQIFIKAVNDSVELVVEAWREKIESAVREPDVNRKNW